MSQGRGSALFVAIVVITIVVLHAGIAEAATYTVGSSGGWTFNVDSWPSGKRFRAGDTLWIHNVVAVNKAGYDGCTTSRGARVYHTGTDQIKLAKGHNYFICTIEGHCASGMKIDIAAMYFTNIFTVQHGINDSTIYFDNNRPANTLLQTTNLHTKYKQSKQHNLTSLSSIHQSTNDHSLAPPNNHTHTQTSTNASPPEKRSFGVATGELFLGIASRILKTTNGTDRVSKVVVEPDVIWEQRVKDVEAEKQRMMMINTTSPGFSFSAAGLLFPYHLGVAQFLIQKGYIKETTPLAGSSAGAIVCAVIASGASMDEAMVATKKLAEDCRLNGTAFRLGAVLREILEEFLPEDVHIRSNGRVRVAVTQILWRPRGLLVDQFDSREDLINAIITSSFIPGYLAPRPATMFRDRLCIDGGLTLFMPPTSAAQTVRICAFPASRLGLQGIGISPDCNPENRSGPRELFNWALEPAEDSILDRLFELGYQDAAVWAEENPAEEIVRDDNACPETGLTL